ncbi:MAG: SpoIIE family protein phosphatase, partial [Leptospiraceae bacterium]|nr:SpoIIE family protein phosphatase [Leptospiraceae bacterium]
DNPFLRLQNLIDRKHFRTIKLKPLNTSNVRELISKIIEIDQDSLSLLSKKIIQLTNGIALYVLDLIKVLLKKEIIHLPKVTKKTTNADRQKWICDFSKIDSLNNEKDINFLLREKYNNIPNEHKNLLKIASCMDSEINLGIISRVAQKDILDCGVIFEDLMWEDIFIATNDNFEYIDTLKEIIEKEPGAKQYLENYTYQFINKDFKDNIYNNYIHSEDKPQLHFEIANQLNKLSKQNNKFYYYEIAHHYNHSKNTRLNNIKELNKIIQANINAANQSIKLNDFPKALPYLRIAYSLSPKNSFDKNKRKNYNLNKDFARILFYLGHYRETAEIINAMYRLKPPKSYHVEFISILLKCHLCIGETKKAVELLNSICDFQPLIPISELYKKYIPLQYHKKKQIKYNGIKSLNAKLNEGTNRDYCIFVFDNFFPLKKDFDNNIILNYANIILEFSKDHSHDVFFSLAYLGYLLLDKKEQKTNGIQLITEAYKYYQSHNITNLYKPLFFYSNYASFYSNSLIDTNNYISQTIKESVNNNEVLLASLSTANLAWNSFFIVENLTIYEKKLTELIQQLDFKGTKEVLISLKILLSFTAIMKGDNKKFVNYKFNQYTIFTYLFARGLLFFHKGRIRRALRYFQLIRTNYLNIIINDYILYELYFYEALCISKQAKKNKLPLNKQFDELLKILQDIKNVNKDLVEHKVLILQAEELCIQNKFWDAQMLYYQAINKAINHFYRWDHAICNELLTEIIIEGFKEEPFIYNLFLNRTKSLFIKLGISYYDNSNVPIDNITFNQDAENSDSDFNEYFIIFKQLYELFRTGKNENEISLNFLKLMQQVSHAERIVYFQQKSGATNSYIVVNDFNKDLSLSPNSIFTTYPNIPRSLINFTIKNKEILSDEMEFDIHQDSYVYKKSYACIPIVEDEIVTHIFLLENENISKLFISKKLKLLHNMGKVIAIYYAMLKQQKQKVIQEHNLYLVDQVKNIQYSLQNSGPIDGFSLSVFSEAIDKSFSGDFYNISIQNGKNYILLGDVTGHGMPANQVMLLILTNIITLINGNPDSNPSSILKKSNIFLSENLKKVTNMDYTFPVFLMAGTEKKGYSFSGSVGLFLHYKKKENQVEQIHTSDILFGFSAQSNDFIDKKCIVEQGDIILLATDGLIEAELEMTKEYIDIKIDEINEILTKNSNLDVESLNHILIQYFSKFGFIDDVTMILLKKE